MKKQIHVQVHRRSFPISYTWPNQTSLSNSKRVVANNRSHCIGEPPPPPKKWDFNAKDLNEIINLMIFSVLRSQII